MKSFKEIHMRAKSAGVMKTVALVCAEDAHLQRAIAAAEREGLIKPMFIGDENAIRSTAASIGYEIVTDNIFHAVSPAAAAALGVRLIREGTADLLMKGKLSSDVFLKPVSNKNAGLAGKGVMSHVAINQLPNYHKLLFCTDGGMLPYPTLAQKCELIKNVVYLLHRLGYDCPKVCALTAVEKVNPKMPETVEAAALKELNLNGNITGCIVEGPIPLDLAVNKEVAEKKGYISPCAGDADILVVPNIHVGSIMGKTMVDLANAKMAGLILGAQCPIVPTARRASTEEKYHSLIMACAM